MSNISLSYIVKVIVLSNLDLEKSTDNDPFKSYKTFRFLQYEIMIECPVRCETALNQ